MSPLQAPAHWRAIEFISDLHLSESAPRTVAALLDHLRHSDADAILLLGDVFEIWIGDDVLDPPPLAAEPPDGAAGPHRRGFEADLLGTLADCLQHRWVGFMAGNRDFLVGADALQRCGWHALPDPLVLDAFGQRLLLSHGDALCLADHDYQIFRAQSRQPDWQARFLGQPLGTRRVIARQLRDESENRKNSVGFDGYADVDSAEALRWLQAAGAHTLVHGHTHRPGRQPLDSEHTRWVLSDWDLDHAATPRADLLRLSAQGLERITPAALAPRLTP